MAEEYADGLAFLPDGLVPNGVDLRNFGLFHEQSFRVTRDHPLDGIPSPMGT
jgi:hypothetical protein